MSQVERRAFQVDKSILWSIIQNQAGTLSKGFLELVMNSVDAGASKVEITLNAKSFVVVDDGKGFVSRDEIERFFETFGTPHKEGDATFGKFRMGRGQIMSFSHTLWRSGEFAMDVDIRDRGLEYELHTLPEAAVGCMIEGTLYDELKPSELLQNCQALEELCKYCPIPVMLNGERISVDMTKEKWTHQDDDAYYLIRGNARTLEAFNLGVSVRHYDAGTFGVGGIVVSKRALEVNFARNDILLSKCEVWKRVSKVLRQFAKAENSDAKVVKNEAWRVAQARKIASGDVETINEWFKLLGTEKVLTDVRGRHITFNDLLTQANQDFSGTISEARAANDRVADRVHQVKLALVLSHRTADRFGVRSFPEVLKLIRRSVKRLYPNAKPAEKYSYGSTLEDIFLGKLETLGGMVEAIDQVGASIRTSHKILGKGEILDEETMVLRAAEEAQYVIWRSVANTLNSNMPKRALRAGESETALAWTDGSSYIAIERKLLKIGGYQGRALSAFAKIASILVHEYLHNDDDTSGHMHDAEFFEHFEQVSCQGNAIGAFIDRALGIWLNLKRKQAKKQPRGVLEDMDRMQAMDDFGKPIDDAQDTMQQDTMRKAA